MNQLDNEKIEILKKFNKYKQQLIEDCLGREILAIEKFDEGRRLGISKNTLRKFFDSNVCFGTRTMKKLIAYYEPDEASSLYYTILGQIRAEQNDQNTIEKYSGKYQYFRRGPKGEIVDGSILIRDKDKRFVFYHSNKFYVKFSPERKHDHEGNVFRIGSRIYMMGIGVNYLRTAVFYKANSIANDFLVGFVITNSFPEKNLTSSQPEGTLFAARFVMYHETHPNYNKLKCDDNEIETILTECAAEDDVGVLKFS